MSMYIPNDVIVEIFSKLPAKSLVRLRWVCKYWFKVITDPIFVKMHLNHVHATNNPLVLIVSPGQIINELFSVNFMDHDVLPPLLDIKVPVMDNSWWLLESCNGLLCIGLSGQKILIWNPCTKQYKIIWQDTSPKQFFISRSYGFGYDCSIDDYKVIRNICSYNESDTGYNGETLVDVYTLGTNSTKKLCNSRFFVDDSDSGLFVNRDLYWKARLRWSEQFNIIIAFDIAKEEYRQIANPPCINYNVPADYYYTRLGKLKGCLCVLYITSDQQSVEVWVMKQNIAEDMNLEYSWDKLYTVLARWPIVTFWKTQLLNFCRNGEIAMMLNYTYLSLYDPKNNEIRSFHPVCPDRVMMQVETYIESLVSIKGGTYMGQEP